MYISSIDHAIREFAMGASEIQQLALKLPPAERFDLIDLLLKSLDQPDPEIEQAWGEEALRRLRAIDEGRMGTVSLEEALGKA